MSYGNYKQLFLRAPRWARIAILRARFRHHRGDLDLVYQVVRKPTELFFPVSGTLYKIAGARPGTDTAPSSAEHSTAAMTPELLAALAQVEGAGNPSRAPTGAGA